MSSHSLCLNVDDCSSVGEIVNKASVLLKASGHREWEKEMAQRINEANTTEEVFRIIDDYVEIV